MSSETSEQVMELLKELAMLKEFPEERLKATRKASSLKATPH